MANLAEMFLGHRNLLLDFGHCTVEPGQLPYLMTKARKLTHIRPLFKVDLAVLVLVGFVNKLE